MLTKLKKKLKKKVINKEQVVLLHFDKVIFGSSERLQTLGLECQRIHCSCILCAPVPCSPFLLEALPTSPGGPVCPCVQNLNNIEKGLPLKPFVYHNKGSMATVGRNNAIVELKNIRFGGFPAWAVWLFIHLMSIVGVKNRLFIFIDWMWSYFTYDPSLRLIIKPVKRVKPKK